MSVNATNDGAHPSDRSAPSGSGESVKQVRCGRKTRRFRVAFRTERALIRYMGRIKRVNEIGSDASDTNMVDRAFTYADNCLEREASCGEVSWERPRPHPCTRHRQITQPQPPPNPRHRPRTPSQPRTQVTHDASPSGTTAASKSTDRVGMSARLATTE